jgi:two-component sensor histidine kinase
MKFIRQILLLLIIPLCSNAQNGVYFIPSDKQADSVRAFLKHTTNDTLKMSIFYELSGYYTELNKDTSLYYAELQLQSAKNLQQPLWAADAYFQIAYLSHGLGNYPVALNAIEEGLAITDDENSEKNNWRIKTFSGDGSRYKARLFIAAALHQIFAFLYQSTDNILKAIEQFNTAIQLAEKVDNKAELSLDYMSLSEIYNDMGKPDSALIIQNKARQYAIESNYKIYMGLILNEIGNIYFLKEQYDLAGSYYRESLRESIEQFNVRDEIYANLALAKWSRKTGNADSSLLYAREALRRVQSLGVASTRASVYNEFFTVFKELDNRDSAFAYLQLAKLLDDSLHNVQLVKTNQYQSLNLNNQISLQQKEKEKIQSANLNRTYGLLGGIGVLLTIAFLLYRNGSNRKKANTVLENTLAALNATQTSLVARNAENELLLKEIHHRVKNNLEIVSSLLALQSNQIDDAKTKEAMLEGQNRVQSIGIVHQKLYQSENLGAIEMKDYFINLSESILDSFGAYKRVEVECAMNTLNVDVDTAVPLGLIVNELLTNTIKYAFPDGRSGKIQIKLEQMANGNLQMRVSDNGVGKSGAIKGTGFGGQLISLLTQQLGGTMKEQNNNGTDIFFEFKSVKAA